MGFSGGGSNITKSHTHSSSIVQDGGALNFSNVTQAGMAARDITYSNGTALQILNLGSATDTLTVNAGATAPEWVTAAAGGSTMEFIATQTSTGSDFTEFTFADAVNYDDYSEMFCTFSYGTPTVSKDLNVRVGDTSAGGVVTTSTYDLCLTNNDGGTLVSSAATSGEWYFATSATLGSQAGVSGYVRVYLIRDSDETFLAAQSMIQAEDNWWVSTGKNTTSDLSDLKYFHLYVNGTLASGSNITCYKIKRS